MAHLLDMSRGRAAIAYVGATPWHGLGQQLTANASIETWLREAGLAFTAIKTAVQYQTPAGVQVATDKAVIYRDDTGASLGVVGDGYEVVQPSAVMELFRDLTEQYGYHLETAGALKGGRQVWALARGEQSAIIGDTEQADKVRDYLLCSTSFDGSRATVTRKTGVRVVCNNTLTLAEQGRGGHRVSHKTKWVADDAKRSLGVGAFAQFADMANRLAETKIEAEQIVPVLLAAYHNLTVEQVQDAEKAASSGDRKATNLVANVNKTLTRLSEIMQTAPGQNLKSASGTAWGLVNAVTYDVDHSKPAHNQENRLNSAWFGPGDDLKTSVYNSAVAMIGDRPRIMVPAASFETLMPAAETVDGAGLLSGLLNRPARIAA